MSDFVEVLSPDGRIFYFSPSLQESTWEKPDSLKSATEKSVDLTDWREYRIWDGRSFYHNLKSKVSVWAAPPEVSRQYSLVTGDAMDLESTCEEPETTTVALDTRSEFISELNKIFPDLSEDITPETVKAALTSEAVFQKSSRLLDEMNRKRAVVDFLIFRDRVKLQRSRDEERIHARDMILWLMNRTQSSANQIVLDQSSSFDHIIPLGSQEPFWKKIPEVRKRELFEAFIADVSRCKTRDENARDAVNMQALKNSMMSAMATSAATEDFEQVRNIFGHLEAWQNLGEAQRVAVWRSSVAQYLRGLRAAISAGEGLTGVAKMRRRAKDLITGTAHGLDIETLLKENSEIDEAVLRQVFNDFLDGKNWEVLQHNLPADMQY